MLKKLESLETLYLDLEQKLSDPAVIAEMDKWTDYAKKHADLAEIVAVYRKFKSIDKELNDTRLLLQEDLDQELRELAEAELEELTSKKQELEENLRIMLLPQDPAG
jgi:peptide chain release factor 1